MIADKAIKTYPDNRACTTCGFIGSGIIGVDGIAEMLTPKKLMYFFKNFRYVVSLLKAIPARKVKAAMKSSNTPANVVISLLYLDCNIIPIVVASCEIANGK